MYKKYIKRIIDILLSLMAIVLFSPIMLLSFSLLVISSQSLIVFFIQERPGLSSIVFKLFKFKTMKDKKDKNGKLLPDKDRLTPIGRITRSLSIDELPQLINVLKGDMSLVGPRPLLVQYLPLYNEKQRRRHEVRPGITGWAQVNGRNAISWEQKFEFDVWYVDNCSFLLDLKIMYMTIKKVFVREGINASQTETMDVFKGNPIR